MDADPGVSVETDACPELPWKWTPIREFL